MEINEVVQKNIKFLLDHSDMSLRELSRRLGVSPSVVSEWCRGKKTPQLKRIDQMCRIFYVTRDDMVHPMTEESLEESRLARQGVELFSSLSSENKAKAIGYMEALK